VRERLLRDEESAPWLQRKHFRTQATGFATVGEAAAADAAAGAAEGAEEETIYTKPKVEEKIKARMAEAHAFA